MMKKERKMTDSEKELSVGEDFLESLASSNLANWQAINEMTANQSMHGLISIQKTIN